MKHLVRVYKKREAPNKGMWMGDCTCGDHAQYWAWGATLGRMLQHAWSGKSR